MKATLKSADGQHEHTTAVSEPPPITLVKRKELWGGGLRYGLEDLPIYIHNGDVIHFKLASVIKYPKPTPPRWAEQPDEAIYCEVGEHEAELARAQVAKEAEQHRALREYERAQAERVLKLQVEEKVAAQQQAIDKAMLHGPQKLPSGNDAFWQSFAHPPLVERSVERPAVPEPDEPKKRMMKK